MDRWVDTPHPAAIALALSPALALSWSTPAVAEPSVAKVEVSGTAFRVTRSDGSVKEGVELQGAVLVFKIAGNPVRIRIANITPDPNDDAVLLHDFRIDGTDVRVCSPDPDGNQVGFPLAGHSSPDGRLLEAAADVFELICTAGAQGKCVRFGYHPWKSAPDGSPMRDHYNACVRMVRADYCGDGRGWTRDGMMIDVWDDHGIQKTDANSNPTLSFEAGWMPAGAVCVAHTRVPDNITLDELKASCPRLASAPTCDEASARAAGALLFNRSR